MFSKPSYTVRFFQQSQLVSPARGFITWLQFCPFHICWGSPVQSGAKRPDLKTQRLVCWEREKLEPGNTAVWLGFSSEDDYPVRNIDEPVRLSNEPARIGGPARLRNEPVRVVKKHKKFKGKHWSNMLRKLLAFIVSPVVMTAITPPSNIPHLQHPPPPPPVSQLGVEHRSWGGPFWSGSSFFCTKLHTKLAGFESSIALTSFSL